MIRFAQVLSVAGLILSQFAHAAPPNADRIVRLAAPDFWCPYACEAKAKRQGFAVDLATAALQEEGYTVEYRTANYARLIQDTREGRYDGIPSVLKPEAPDFVYPTEAVASMAQCFWTKKDATWTYEGAGSLKNAPGKLGIINGYTMGDEVDQAMKANPKAFEVLAGDEGLFRGAELVKLGRIVAVGEEPISMAYYRNEGRIPELRKAGCSYKAASFLGLTPKRPERSKEIAAAFDRGMRKLREKKLIDDIVAKYGLSEKVIFEFL